MIEPSLPGWRIRAGIGAAAVVGLVAIAGGMSAGLETSSGWSNEASAAVVPEVLYLEEARAKLATIARVNGDIADEVTVDVRLDRLARRTDTDARPSSTNSVMDAPDVQDGSSPSSKDERTAPEGAADGNGGGNGGGGGGKDETGPGTVDAPPKADEPAATPVPKAEPKTEPKTEDPGPTPTPTVPAPGNGNGNTGGGPPDDRGKPTEDRDKRTVDAKSADQTAAKEQTP